jgi:hypothetical protein
MKHKTKLGNFDHPAEKNCMANMYKNADLIFLMSRLGWVYTIIVFFKRIFWNFSIKGTALV